MEPTGLDKLIAGLTILRKYGNPDYPTCCQHDVLIVAIDPEQVNAEDTTRLEELGFIPSEEFDDSFISFEFGSN